MHFLMGYLMGYLLRHPSLRLWMPPWMPPLRRQRLLAQAHWPRRVQLKAMARAMCLAWPQRP
jgi:hypothetical protein